MKPNAVIGALSPEIEMGTFKTQCIDIFFSLEMNSTLQLPVLLHNYCKSNLNG